MHNNFQIFYDSKARQFNSTLTVHWVIVFVFQSIHKIYTTSKQWTRKLQNYLFAFIPCSLSFSQSNQVNQNVTSVGNSKGIIWLNHRVKHFTLRGRRSPCNVIRKRTIQLLSIRGLQWEDLKWLPTRSIIIVCSYMMNYLHLFVCAIHIMIISGTILIANQCYAQ